MKTLFKIAGMIILVAIVGGCKTASSSNKPQPENITGKYWKLIELYGKPVVWEESFKREPFFILKNEGNRVNGHGGCNTFFGTFEINPAANRIKFSQMANSLMLCLNMEIEDGLKKALMTTDNYTMSSDGKYLSLNKARMALARFEEAHFE